MKFARQIGRKRETVEAFGLVDQTHSGGDGFLVGLRAEDLRVAGDVSGLDPIGAAGIDGEREEPGFGGVEEAAGVFDRGGGGEGTYGSEEEEGGGAHVNTITRRNFKGGGGKALIESSGYEWPIEFELSGTAGISGEAGRTDRCRGDGGERASGGGGGGVARRGASRLRAADSGDIVKAVELRPHGRQPGRLADESGRDAGGVPGRGAGSDHARLVHDRRSKRVPFERNGAEGMVGRGGQAERGSADGRFLWAELGIVRQLSVRVFVVFAGEIAKLLFRDAIP